MNFNSNHNNKMTPIELLQSYKGKVFDISPSPFTKWLAPTVIDASEGRIVFEFTVRPEWLNPMHNIHGGVTAAIIDDVIGTMMFSLGEDSFYTTINNTIDYFSVAKAGDKITAETKIIKKGKQFVHAECEIWNPDHTRMIARGTSNLFKTSLQK